MTQWRRRRLWTSLSAVALLAPASTAVPAAPQALDTPALAGAPTASAPASDARQGGEGGEGGGEGGEGGVDPVRAARDPVAYLIALDVIRAHYLAGLGAYEAGETVAAAEMFVHPIAEIYFDLEEIFVARGVEPFNALMVEAGDRAFESAPLNSVRQAGEAVLAATAKAAEHAPESALSPAAIEADVIADMIDRAALQYRLVQAAGAGEAYLDGYGYFKAAETRAAKAGDAIRAVDALVWERIESALDLLGQAYPAAVAPEVHAVEPGGLLAASSRVALATGGMR